MSNIKAGVVLVQKFCESGSDTFSTYIDYIDREEAIRQPNEYKFNMFSDYVGNYMDNKEKTTGIFTSDKDSLTVAEKQKLKEIFQMAQKNKSLMWQTVVSFDNRWLKKNGVILDGIINENQIKEIGRNGILKLLKNEHLENAIWSASIHYNTDNIHIHYAIVEPKPMREKKEYNGKMQYKGKMKLSSLEKAKSIFVNSIIQNKDLNIRLTELIRNDIVKDNFILENTRLDFQNQFLDIFADLEKIPLKFWTYNSNKIAPLRSRLDEMSINYIKQNHAKELKEIMIILDHQESLYKEGYGGLEDFNYKENKLNDLHERLGNRLLKEMKKLHHQIEKKTEAELQEMENNQESIIFKLNQIKKSSLKPQKISFHNSYKGRTSKKKRIFDGKLIWEDYKKMYDVANMGRYYLDKDEMKGVKILEKAVEEKNGLAGVFLANYYTEVKEFDKAQEVLKICMPIILNDVNHSKEFLKEYLCYQVGRVYQSGMLGEEQKHKAKEFFRNSSLTPSEYQYAKEIKDENPEKAKELFERIIKKKKDNTSFFIGMSAYQIGKLEENIFNNPTNAYFYYEKAHEMLRANYTAVKLGFMNFQGKGVPKNLELASEYFMDAAINEYKKNAATEDCISIAMLQTIEEIKERKNRKSIKNSKTLWKRHREYFMPSLRKLKKYFSGDLKAIRKSIQEYDQLLENKINQDYYSEY